MTIKNLNNASLVAAGVFPEVPSLAEVIERIATMPDLTDWRRRDVLSSLRCLTRILDLPAEEIPASRPFLRERLKDFHPQQAGLSTKRWKNVRSDIAFALDRAGSPSRTAAAKVPLLPVWTELLSKAPAHLRYALSRFARWCSSQGIEPAQVDEAILARFGDALVVATLVADPSTRVRLTARSWNQAAQIVAGWPSQRLVLPTRHKLVSLPWQAFPTSLRADLDAYLARAGGADLLDEAGPIRPLAPLSLRSRAYHVQQCASALVHSGAAQAQELVDLAFLIEPGRLKAALRWLLARRGGKTSPYIFQIAISMKVIARHHVGAGEPVLAELGTICRRLDPGGKGLTARNRARLRQFDDPRNVALLLHAPRRLLTQAKRRPLVDRAGALQVQMALAIEFLLFCPIRIRNLAGIHLDRHLAWTRSARAGVCHLVIGASETKNHQEIQFELPRPLVDLLQLYLKTYHPLLSDTPSRWLFPGLQPGVAKRPATLSKQISDQLFALTGLQVHAHLFRHIAAKLYLDHDPGAYELMRRVLGHASLNKTINAYTGLETAAANRHFDERVLRLREATRNLPTRRGAGARKARARKAP